MAAIVASTVNDNSQFAEKFAVLANGNYAVSYMDYSYPPEQYVTVLRPDGTREYTRAIGTDDYYDEPVGWGVAPYDAPPFLIAMADGGFMAVWGVENYPGSGDAPVGRTAIRTHILPDAPGSIGEQVLVKSDPEPTYNDGIFPADVETADNGYIFVAWEQNGTDAPGSGGGVDTHLTILSPTGLRLVPRVDISNGPSNSLNLFLVPLSDGLMGAYTYEIVGTGSTYAQTATLHVFDRFGARLDTLELGSNNYHSMVQLSDGRFAAMRADGSAGSIDIFGAAGKLLVSGIEVSTVFPGNIRQVEDADMLALPDGGFAIAFRVGSDLYLREFEADGTAGRQIAVGPHHDGFMPAYDPEIHLEANDNVAVYWSEVIANGENDPWYAMIRSVDLDSGFFDIVRDGERRPVSYLDLADALDEAVSGDMVAAIGPAEFGASGPYRVRHDGVSVSADASVSGGSAPAFALADDVRAFSFLGKAAMNVLGNGRDNVLSGNDGANALEGFGGSDKLSGGKGKDTLDGGDGNDVLIGGPGADRLIGGEGGDTASYEDAKKGVAVNLKNPKKNKGDAAGDTYRSVENLTGSKKADMLSGNDSANVLKGLGGSDRLVGGKGKDTLEGGPGKDMLTGGGGTDSFVFASIKDSPAKKKGWDVITDFSRKQGDRIDLKAIDAKAGSKKNDAFTFIGKDKFSGRKGELRFDGNKKKTFVYGDVNGDKVADLRIELTGKIDLKDGDFVL